ncbi:hypothetical protein F0562_019798 [Nyssa sinensis]|uniref:SMP domain-containing protein n=1 Tax=Nyssa sinensis TaxID=561372 RepID=A0A5J5BPU1_9ASTE|nr:hypothetical protein F0562_019798 [Nyssa sinensis]
MSHEQPRRPESQQEAIKYGDVSGQAVENAMLEEIEKGGAASVMQSLATQNDVGVGITEKDILRGRHIITESVGGQDATAKLPADKPVTRRDAEGVIGAELRNDPNLTTRPGGVAASVAAAARLNQNK